MSIVYEQAGNTSDKYLYFYGGFSSQASFSKSDYAKGTQHFQRLSVVFITLNIVNFRRF